AVLARLTPGSSPGRRIQGSDMSSQQTPQAQRFPIEAGDCPRLAVPPETQEPADAEQSVGRQLRRCPGSHCLTLPNVPIDVFMAMGGSRRPR
ncbi:F229A protein, partial [Arenaria interpres]|nr:F229A protein [Arenaria interpres]